MDDVVAGAEHEHGHEAILELLPDYALGSLGDADLRRVSWHLDACPACRRSLARLLETIGLLPGVAPPPQAVRGALVARAVASRPAGNGGVPTPVLAEPARRVVPIGLPVPRTDSPPAGGRGWAWLRRFALAAASVLLVTLGGWNARLRQEVDDRAPLADFLSGPALAHPLTDSELSPPASGLLFTDAASDRALLVASNLPPLPPGHRYRIWLITGDESRVSGGAFEVDARGHAEVSVQAPSTFASYLAVGIEAEPLAGSPASTSPLALGAWLPEPE